MLATFFYKRKKNKKCVRGEDERRRETGGNRRKENPASVKYIVSHKLNTIFSIFIFSFDNSHKIANQRLR